MRRLSLCGLLLTLLAACQVAPPVEPIPSGTAAAGSPPPATRSSASPTATLDPTSAAFLPTLPNGYPAPPTNTPLPPTPSPTITLTPIPTNTPLPTPTATVAGTPVPLPVVLIERPLNNEFVSATVPVAGTVARATGGTVLLSLRTPDGQPTGPEPAPATVSAEGEGLRFSGQIALELPPTPRQAQVIAQWDDGPDGLPAVEASQPVNLEGRYGRVDRLVVEQPQPFARPSADELAVRGVAPGPPSRMLVRLLDDADQVLESIEAELRWYQPGLPCAFAATLPNTLAATQLQVISLGPDDAVIEAVRVRLEPRR